MSRNRRDGDHGGGKFWPGRKGERISGRREGEGEGEELVQGQDLMVAGQVSHDHQAVRAELGQDLAAEAAGGDGLGRVGDDGQGLESPLAGGDGGKDGHPLGADGGAEGGVFDVAAGEDAAVGGEDGGAYGEVGIGGVGGVRRAWRAAASRFSSNAVSRKLPDSF